MQETMKQYNATLSLESSKHRYQFPALNETLPARRAWQQGCYDLLVEDGVLHKYSLIIAAGGAGKTRIVRDLIAHDIVTSGFERSAVVLVPQEQLGNAFAGRGKVLTEVEGNPFELVLLNLCGDITTEKKKHLLDWLERGRRRKPRHPDRAIVSRVVVCTGQLFTQLWLGLSQKKRQRLRRDLTIAFDESHSVSVDRNLLGKVFSDFYGAPEEAGCKVLMATATPERGDEQPIIPTEAWSEFQVYSYPVTEHLRAAGIERVHMRAEVFPGFDGNMSWLELEVQNAFDANRKLAIILPRTGLRGRTPKTFKKVWRVVRRIYGSAAYDSVTTGAQRIEFGTVLRDEERRQQIGAVITCMKVREGTDIPQIDLILNFDPSSSTRLELQTWYRAFRQFPGKNNIEIVTFVPEVSIPDQCSPEGVRQIMSGRNTLLWNRALVLDWQRISSHSALEAPVSPMPIPSLLGKHAQDVVSEIGEIRLAEHEKTPEIMSERIAEVLDRYQILDNREEAVTALLILWVATLDQSGVMSQQFPSYLRGRKQYEEMLRVWDLLQLADNIHFQARGTADLEELRRVQEIFASEYRSAAESCHDTRILFDRLGRQLVHDDEPTLFAHARKCTICDPYWNMPRVRRKTCTDTRALFETLGRQLTCSDNRSLYMHAGKCEICNPYWNMPHVRSASCTDTRALFEGLGRQLTKRDDKKLYEHAKRCVSCREYWKPARTRVSCSETRTLFKSLGRQITCSDNQKLYQHSRVCAACGVYVKRIARAPVAHKDLKIRRKS